MKKRTIVCLAAAGVLAVFALTCVVLFRPKPLTDPAAEPVFLAAYVWPDGYESRMPLDLTGKEEALLTCLKEYDRQRTTEQLFQRSAGVAIPQWVQVEILIDDGAELYHLLLGQDACQRRAGLGYGGPVDRVLEGERLRETLWSLLEVEDLLRPA